MPIEQRAAGLISPARLAPVTGLAQAVVHMPDHLNRAQLEASLPPYNPFEDTEEVLLLFGFSLFAAAFPLAPAIALLVLGLEMWVDKRKALSVQRPMPTRRASLGVYNTAFSALEMLAIASNVAIAYVLWTQKPSRSGGSTGTAMAEGKPVAGESEPADRDATAKLHAVLWFVLLEHAIAGVKVIIDKALPDVPEEVRLAARRQRQRVGEQTEAALAAPPRRRHGVGTQQGAGAQQAGLALAGGATDRTTQGATADLPAPGDALPSHTAQLAPSPVKPLPAVIQVLLSPALSQPAPATSIAYASSGGGSGSAAPGPTSRPLGLQQLLQSWGAVTTAV